mmetsp:Transcript_24938/g.64261  ORF Transcript_24938/g.64261 Transcript_24938/m.64261 type:complete len:301 (-) Transcript_24938:46-948(-)|eukprot:jgi/Tetstr1/422503/TSEL_001265.t1
MGRSGKRKAAAGAAAAAAGGDQRRRAVEEAEESSSEGEEPELNDADMQEADDDEDAFREINVSFEFFDPAEVDFHGLRALLGKYLDGAPFEALSELVEVIIAQSTVGTVMKTAAEEDPIGMVSALNLRRYSTLACLQQVRAFLAGKCKHKATREALDKAWEAEGTALLLTERLMNTPPQIAPPLMQAIFDEIEWATEDEPTQELRDSYKLKQYIVATRVYVDPEAPAPSEGGPVLVYVRPEDELFHKHAAWSFSFPVEMAQVGKGELAPWRLVMAVPAGKVPTVRRELDAAVAAMPPPGA